VVATSHVEGRVELEGSNSTGMKSDTEDQLEERLGLPHAGGFFHCRGQAALGVRSKHPSLVGETRREGLVMMTSPVWVEELRLLADRWRGATAVEGRGQLARSRRR
jgi:hypothetical protein